MTRVKRGVTKNRRHKKILKLTKGFKGLRSRAYRVAKIANMKAGQNEYIGRKLKKRDFRRIWITRINAACRMNDVSYSRFMYGLLKSKVAIDRKMLADLAVNNPEIFIQYVELAKKA